LAWSAETRQSKQGQRAKEREGEIQRKHEVISGLVEKHVKAKKPRKILRVAG
jgi:hypothetical protein